MDIKALYMARRWSPRTETVPVPQLVDVFDTDNELQAATSGLERALSGDGDLPAAQETLARATREAMQRARITVRSLSAHELAQVRMAKSRRDSIIAAAEALANVTGRNRAEFLESVIGHGPEVEAEVAARIEALVLGTVEPSIDLELATHIAKNHAVVLWNVTDRIFSLTDRGSTPGESYPSGTTSASETPA